MKRNSSIDSLIITLGHGNSFLVGRTAHKLLSIYQQNNKLDQFSIHDADLQNRGDNIIATTLQCCTNLKSFELFRCNITSEQLTSMVEPVRRSLQRLHLQEIGIGNTACEALARLLRDPFCVLKSLSLLNDDISISNVGVITIVNSLISNTCLEELYLSVNSNDRRGAAYTFSNLLCNKSSIDSIYSSNHTLNTLTFEFLEQPPQQLIPY